MYVILVYDINTQTKDGQRRLQKMFKLCKQYLFPVQKSVFEGELSESILLELQGKINRLINKKMDSVIFYKMPDDHLLTKDFIGQRNMPMFLI